MNILTMSIGDKICERYEQHRDKFTLVLASKHQEPTRMIAFLEQEKAYTHIQATKVQLLIGTPCARLRRLNRALSRSRSRAPYGTRIGYLTPRTRDRQF